MLEHINLLWFSWINARGDLSPLSVFAATALAEWLIFLVPAGLTGLWLRSGVHAREAAIRACIATMLGLLVNAFIGLLWFHPRPFMEGIGHAYLAHVPDSSFPSDHVTIMTAVGVTLWQSAPRAARRWGMMLLVLVPVVGWARVFLGVHYPFDILGAIIVGILAALAARTRTAQPTCTWLTATAESAYRRVMAVPIARGWLRG